MDVIEEDKVVKKFGIVLRIVKKKNKFIVEQVPLNNDGSYDKGDFTIFGGSVGMDTSEFTTDEDARLFFNDVITLNGNQLEKKYPNLWVS